MLHSSRHFRSAITPLDVFIDDHFNNAFEQYPLTSRKTISQKLQVTRSVISALGGRFEDALPVEKAQATRKCAILQSIVDQKRIDTRTALRMAHIDEESRNFAMYTLQKTELTKSIFNDTGLQRSWADMQSDAKALTVKVLRDGAQKQTARSLMKGILFRNFLRKLERKFPALRHSENPALLARALQPIATYKNSEKVFRSARNFHGRIGSHRKKETENGIIAMHENAMKYPHLSACALRQKLRLMELRERNKVEKNPQGSLRR